MHAMNALVSVLVIATSTFAAAQQASQYTDGQVQVYPTASPPTVPTVTPTAPVPTVTPSSAPPVYGSTATTPTTIVTVPTTKVTVGPVTTTCTTSTLVPSYPASNSTETESPTTGGATGYGTPSETEVSPTGITPTSSPIAPAPNSAGVLGVQMGLAGVAFVGLMALFA